MNLPQPQIQTCNTNGITRDSATISTRFSLKKLSRSATHKIMILTTVADKPGDLMSVDGDDT